MNNANYRSIFCDNIRSLRDKQGLSQEKMAELLEIDVSALQSLEAGTIPTQLSGDIVFRISEVFHLEPGSLFSEGK